MALLGNLTGSSQFFNPNRFYNDIATQSLRFNSADDAYLTREFDAPTNNKKWTYSTWLKRSKLGAHQAIISSNVDGNNYFDFRFSDADILYVQNRVGGSNLIAHGTTAVFRDTSAWYNIVLIYDSDNSTSANRTLLYVNGVNHTLGSVAGNGDASYFNVDNINHNFGASRTADTSGTVWSEFGGYVSEVNFCDGQAYAPTNFGETKNGVWIPKDTSGLTFGNNGFRIRHNQVGVGTASSSTIGADVSGNGNHLTSVNVVASDCAMPDSPENNFATLSPLSVGGGQKSAMNGGASNRTFAEGNLQVSLPDNTWAYNTQVCHSGKWYCEILVKTIGSSDQDNGVGWNHYDNFVGAGSMAGYADSWNVYSNTYSTPYIKLYDETSALGNTFAVTLAEGDIWQLAWDVDAGKGWIGLNNTYYRTNATDGNPSAGSNQTFDFTAEEAQNLLVALGNGNGTNVYVANFGQDGSFAGNKTAQGNTDANGIGDFYYAVPTGFQAVCTKNLADTAIGPNSATQSDDHFNTVLYTGNGGSQSITGVGFQPDWTWIKARSSTFDHVVTDSSRGVEKELIPNKTDAEAQDSGKGLTSFDSDGFSLVLGTNTSYNNNSVTYVGWNWKANGGTTSSNSDGSITSTVQANTTAGFSIVTYTGNATSGATVGHGLGAVPKWYFTKRRANTGHWEVYHASNTTAPATEHLRLSASSGTEDDSSYWNDTDPTSTVFSLGNHVNVNENSNTYVAYCFAEVEGFSKFGSYIANESTDGPFIYLGFRPAWVMIKRTAGNGWAIQDNARTPSNPISNLLQANESNAEYTDGVALDFVSNGIKHRNDSGFFNHVSGDTFIYMAFAEAPFKYANAR